MLSVAFATLKAGRRRLAGTASAIVLGVAFLTGTLVLGDTLNANFTALFTDVTAGTDAAVRGSAAVDPGRGLDQHAPVPESIVSDAAKVPGVAAAVPQLQGTGVLLGRDGRPLGGNGPPRMAANWITDPALNPYRIVDGRPPQAPDEVVVGRGTAEAGSLSVGDRTIVRTPEPVPVRIVGIASFGDEDGFGQVTFTGFSMAGAREHIPHRPGTVTDVLLRAEPGVSEDRLVAAVERALPDGVEAVTGAQLTEERLDDIASTFLDFLRTFLVAFAGIALLAATFSIHNTFSVTVSQRTRELALLRAVGAAKRQVAALLLIESAVIGLLASLAGVAAGIGVAQGLKSVFDAFGFALPDGGLSVTATALLIGLTAGTASAVLAAVTPVRAAVRVPPVAALRESAVEPAGIGRVRVAVGTTLALAGAVAAIPAAVAGGTLLASAGATALVVGALTLTPLGVRPVTALAGGPLGRLTGVSGEVAVRNARRNPRRAAATATALVIGVTVTTTLTIVVASARQVAQGSTQRTFAADLSIAGPGFGDDVLPPRVVTDAAAVPGVAEAVGVSRGTVGVGGAGVPVSAADPAGLGRVLRLQTVAGDAAALAEGGGDRVAVQQAAAAERGWTEGTPLELTFTDGARERVTVAAVYADTSLLGDVVVPDRLWLAHTPQPARGTVYVDLAPGADPATVRRALTPIADRYGAEVRDSAQARDAAATPFDLILNLVYVMLTLAIVIALLGIATTVSLGVHERRRELGLLRAVGQTRRQVRTMVRVESVLFAVFGTAVGLGLGTALGWLLVVVSGDDGSAAVGVPVGRLALVAAVGAAAGLVASLRPGRRAARRPILDALATT
jgi:putative ABC transport system permease protein